MGGLSFLSPLYLLGALAIAVPIILHLFRRRTETVVDFPAVRLLSASPIEQQRRRRLRELVLLALRVTALLLLAGAFARPYLASTTLAADAAVTVVAVDTSFSLSDTATFARARELAVAAVREAPATDAVALMAFGDTATTVATPTTDRGAVIAAIASLAPGASGTRYGAAVARAAELLGGRQGRLVLVTDLQQAGWEGSPRAGLPDDVEVIVRAVDSPLQNVAITAAERRGTRVDAAIHNFGFEDKTVPASLAVDGQVVARAIVNAPAQSAAHVEFDADVPATGAATVMVEDPGGFAADDRRHLVLDPAASARITVIVADPTALRGGLYVERALEAASGGRAFTATVVDGRALSGWTADQLAREHALIVLGTRTLERSGRELVSRYLTQGGSVLLSLGPEVDPGTLTDVMGDASGISPDPQAFGNAGATLVLGDTRHPIFRLFAEPAAALGDVSFLRYRPVDESGRSVLARYSGGAPALLEVPLANGPPAAVHFGSRQSVEPLPAQPGLRAVHDRERALSHRGAEPHAVVGAAGHPAGAGAGARRVQRGRDGRGRPKSRPERRYQGVESVADLHGRVPRRGAARRADDHGGSGGGCPQGRGRTTALAARIARDVRGPGGRRFGPADGRIDRIG